MTSFLVWTAESVDHFLPRAALPFQADLRQNLNCLEAPCSLDRIEWTGESSNMQVRYRNEANELQRLEDRNNPLLAWPGSDF